MQIATDNHGLVYHGREVYFGQYAMYDLMAAHGVRTLVWDANLDGIYDNYIDL